jgi:gliding motility-associated-like protein
LFNIIGAQYVKDFTMQIYNRWGKIIFETRNVLSGWDGTVAGVKQPEGVYIVKIRYVNVQTGKVETYSGRVVIIR